MNDKDKSYINLIDVETRARVLNTQELGYATVSMFKFIGRMVIGIFAAIGRFGEKIDECHELHDRVEKGQVKSINIKDHFI